ncbi:MAG: phosphatidate cytidylyltransferase [Rhodospirillaceae bacterium]|nr:phosphatidate cytidylyltransferase [Rhodospirillaceae bacterium]
MPTCRPRSRPSWVASGASARWSPEVSVLRTRLISGLILAPLFLLIVSAGSPYFDLLVAAIVVAMAIEFTRMDGQEGGKRRALMAAASLTAVAAASVFGNAGLALALVFAATVLVVLADQLAGRRGFAVVQATVAYAAIPAISLVFVMRIGGTESVYWLLAVVWGTDIGAYAVGRTFGGPKLAPAISPNKTWSGAGGGLVIGTGAGLGLIAALNGTVDVTLTLMSSGLSILTQLGDLFESGLKRRYAVKDSGGLIPGHGGVMDRFDGLWAAAPAAALMCAYFKGGVLTW